MKAIRMLSRWKRRSNLLGDCLTVTVDEYVDLEQGKHFRNFSADLYSPSIEGWRLGHVTQ